MPYELGPGMPLRMEPSVGSGGEPLGLRMDSGLGGQNAPSIPPAWFLMLEEYLRRHGSGGVADRAPVAPPIGVPSGMVGVRG
jgi:hypothetical protein